MWIRSWLDWTWAGTVSLTVIVYCTEAGKIGHGLAPFPSLSLCIALKLGRLDMGLAPFPSLSLCIALKLGRLDMGRHRFHHCHCALH